MSNDKKNMKPILVKLLQGFLTKEHKKLWDNLIIHQEYIRSYFQILGLYLHLSVDDGYAFLKTSPEADVKLPDLDDDDNDNSNDNFLDDDQGNNHDEHGLEKRTSLIKKFPLTFEVSLLLVLLRESLEQFDEKVSDDYRLILKRGEIYELLQTFYFHSHSGGDETKINKKFDAIIARVCQMGFLKELKNQSFEVERMIKAFITASYLVEFKNTMKSNLNQQQVEGAR